MIWYLWSYSSVSTNLLASQVYDFLRDVPKITLLVITVVFVLVACLIFLRFRIFGRYEFVLRGRTGLLLTKKEDKTLTLATIPHGLDHKERFAHLPYGAKAVLDKYFCMENKDLDPPKESDDQRLVAELLQYLLIRRYEWRTGQDCVWWKREWLYSFRAGSSPGANYPNKYLPFSKIRGSEQNRFLKHHDALPIGTTQDIGNWYDRFGVVLILPPGIDLVVDNSAEMRFCFEGRGWKIQTTLSGASGSSREKDPFEISYNWEIAGSANSWGTVLTEVQKWFILAPGDTIRKIVSSLLTACNKIIRVVFKNNQSFSLRLQMGLAWRFSVPFEEYYLWVVSLVKDFQVYLSYQQMESPDGNPARYQ